MAVYVIYIFAILLLSFIIITILQQKSLRGLTWPLEKSDATVMNGVIV